jgi:rubrerythrin
MKKSAKPARTRTGPKRNTRASRAGASDPAGFMARAWAMEVEAVERYTMLADAMEEHNNRDVAELFRKLARIEQLHADRIAEESFARGLPALPPGGVEWEDGEGPETADPGELHYRMQPYHALQIALAAERRAQRFFSKMARASTSSAVRTAAREMAAEEGEHVRLIEDWIKRTPLPDKDWEHDPDPPTQSD